MRVTAAAAVVVVVTSNSADMIQTSRLCMCVVNNIVPAYE